MDLSRTEMLIGSEAVARLKRAKVAVFGVGGVGGFAAEALARAGIGELHLFDNDVVSESNINRQIVALTSTFGSLKVDVMARRIKDINPDCKVLAYPVFYTPSCADDYDLTVFDYVVDAIDTVTAKIELAVRCTHAGVPIVSSMGSGNKLDATGFTIADITETSVCPLARVMRRELKARGIAHLNVVYSKTPPVPQAYAEGERRAPASISYVPPVAGMIVAQKVITDLIKDCAPA